MAVFKIITLGCKVNQYESDCIANSLIKKGWSMAHSDEAPDYCIINTCTVTGKAAMQSRQVIRAAIRNRPDAQIIVTGCYAQIEPEKIKNISGVHTVISNPQKPHIPDMLLSKKRSSSPSPSSSSGVINTNIFNYETSINFGNRTRPLLKIQDGCNSFCTYCIVPHARGTSQSMPLDDVTKNVQLMQKAGVKEIVLTGIHLGSYGADLSPSTTLLSLMRVIERACEIDRIRLSSIEPADITNEIIGLIAGSSMFCQHFHIPLQSGDDTILSRMKRPYDGSFFRERILKIHDTIPDAGIGVDILIGFPGETDEAFEKTYSLINELPVTYLHVFPFSPRKGTPAAYFKDKISRETIRNRSKIMRDLGLEKKKDFYKSLIGKNVRVLFEGKKDGPSGQQKGLTTNYVTVLIDESEDLQNQIITVRLEDLITRSEKGSITIMLVGKRIKD